MTPLQLAEMLQVPLATLYSWRKHGGGPPAVKLGRRLLRYRRSEIERWLKEPPG